MTQGLSKRGTREGSPSVSSLSDTPPGEGVAREGTVPGFALGRTCVEDLDETDKVGLGSVSFSESTVATRSDDLEACPFLS